MQRIVRRLRILEYVGTEEFVNAAIERCTIKGLVACGNGSIRSGWIGETNEVLTDAELDAIETQRKLKGL